MAPPLSRVPFLVPVPPPPLFLVTRSEGRHHLLKVIEASRSQPIPLKLVVFHYVVAK